jgi:hypothetical protein
MLASTNHPLTFINIMTGHSIFIKLIALGAGAVVGPRSVHTQHGTDVAPFSTLINIFTGGAISRDSVASVLTTATLIATLGIDTLCWCGSSLVTTVTHLFALINIMAERGSM